MRTGKIANPTQKNKLRTGKIPNISQADELRLKVMKLLGIPKNDTYKAIRELSRKFTDEQTTFDESWLALELVRRLDTSLRIIIDNLSISTVDDSIADRWNKKDKKYFKPHLTMDNEYAKIIKTYFFQKYGMEFTKENVKKIQEK